MAEFISYDGTPLAYRSFGDGPPLVCLPGGPMRDSAYLGELGGLSAHRRLIMLDLRGTGRSALPGDPASYRCDRQVADVEALREHLGLDRIDLLGHSAGTNLAVLYAARRPERVGRLLLVTPSPMVLGIEVTAQERLATARLRAGEPWFAAAYAALESVAAGRPAPGAWEAVAPLRHGRWDAAARELDAGDEVQRNAEAAAGYGAEGAYDPTATRAALAAFAAPVLVLAGEVDLNSPPAAMAELAGAFPGAGLLVQPGAGHYPWLDDAARFTAAAEAFLAG
ncbi:alpha/beta hydrolase [Streptomyces bambusae]|uniref:alpha/beta fold hydrolase n=1 Tax=Streptomyces bambusae TaxID=1550616 RepID=UPI001CFD1BA1|nr:alpha/beta hydrolase [Streptomyces bambusae]MCB5167753.1 alpha/beta hydrolase [Streptomyces bambusae]